MDYSLLLIFFKKNNQNKTELEEHKNMKMSIYLKKGEDGSFI